MTRTHDVNYLTLQTRVARSGLSYSRLGVLAQVPDAKLRAFFDGRYTFSAWALCRIDRAIRAQERTNSQRKKPNVLEQMATR